MNIKNKIKIFLFLNAVVAVFSVADFVSAAPSNAGLTNNFNITAYILDKNSQSIADGEYDVRFTLYDKDRTQLDPYPSNSDSKLWQETQKIYIFQGVLSANLGTTNKFPMDLDFNNGNFYIGIRIGTDSEMAPRKKLSSVPFANNAALLNGKTVGNQAGDIPVITAKGSLDAKILGKINQVGTISNGTWEGSVIADSFIANDLTGKTYNGIKLSSNAGTHIVSISVDTTIDQDLSKSSDVTFKSLALTNALGTSSGGTGISSYAAGDMLFASAANVLGKIAIGANNQILSIENGIPKWKSLNLADIVTGILPVANGGTGNDNFAQGSVVFSDGTKLTQSNADFFWDNVNGRLGIGTANPAALFSVGATSQFQVDGSGNINAGKWNADTLDVAHGGTGATGTPGNGQVLIGNGTGYAIANITPSTGISISNGPGTINIVNTGVTQLSGTPNQVTVSASNGAITVSLPQNISTTSSASFSSLTLSSPLTIANGGTGLSSYSAGDILFFSSGNTFSRRAIGSEGQALTVVGGVPTWGSVVGSSHDLLSASHSDTTVAAVARGGLIAGIGSPATWSLLNPGTNGQFLKANGVGSDLSWAALNKTDVGLGNVENTALSTWSGSVSITTLGNVISGNWNGNVIGMAYGGLGGDVSTLDGLLKISGGVASVITDNSANWNTAYAWGNHASQGYITASSTDTLTNKSGNISMWTNDAGYVTSFSETDPVFSASAAVGITNANIANWNTAYAWGNHAIQGYITASSTDILTNKTWNGNAIGMIFGGLGGDVSTFDGLVKISGGVASAIGDNSANWNDAYTNRLISANGTSPLTLTLASNGLTGSIADATVTTKGVASFDGTNFNVASGVVNTIQNIATTSSPTFAGQTINGSLNIKSGTYGTIFQNSGLQTADIAYNLPVAGGSAGQVLKTDASGNLYWATVSGGSGGIGTVTSVASGNGLTGGPITETGTLSISLLGANGGTALNSSFSGLQFSGSADNQLSLLQGCVNNEVLAWNSTGKVWQCSTVSGVGGITGSGTNNYVTFWTGTGSLGSEQFLDVSRGGTGTGALTQGSIVFAGAGGVYSQDNANLFWDSVNKRLGIGTAAPRRKTEITSNFSTGGLQDLLYLVATYGDGTDTPIGFGASLRFRQTMSSGIYRDSGLIGTPVENASGYSSGLAFYTQNNSSLYENMRISGTGNVGIGTTNPLSMLSVGATSQFQVNSSGNVTGGKYNGNTISTGTGTLNLGAYALVLTGSSNINQNLLTTSAPTFAGMTLNGNLDLGGFTFTTTNSTAIANLNSDMLDGNHAAAFALLAGRAGGQTLIGGSAVADALKLQGTSGSGTATAPAIQALVGNNGATAAMTILNNGNVGIGTTNPTALFSVGPTSSFKVTLAGSVMTT
ncbi:MAG: hypothetical protein PHW24_04715, partial [Candidatus Moranbacteria bacterium]|nr:hypothetical protein [Candidatus Moranbacteria bacterium]